MSYVTKKRLPIVVWEILAKAYISGNFETQGSKFRHETVGLLPS